MKKLILSGLALAFAATTVMANGTVPAKNAKAKHATCTSCPKGQKCTKTQCTKADCCE